MGLGIGLEDNIHVNKEIGLGLGLNQDYKRK